VTLRSPPLGLLVLVLASRAGADPPAPAAVPAGPTTAAPTPPAPAASPPSRVLTLAEALETARTHQPQLRQARALAVAARARADEARAPLLPQVSGTASWERTTTNVVPRPGVLSARGPNSFTTSNYWSFGVTLNQIVFDFGQAGGRWRAARASAASQQDSEAAAALQTTLGVRMSFFAARAARDLVGVARDNLANLQTHLRQTEAFVRLGTHPAIDLALARTNAANAEVQSINAENGYLTAKAQLNQAMGDDRPADYEVSDDGLAPVEGEDQPLDALLAEALQHRPDVAALLELARAQELTVGAVRGAFAPSVGLFTGFSSAGPTPAYSVPNWDAGLALTWPIFQGGLTTAQVQEATANLDAARAQADALRQQVRVEVEQARLAVRAAKSSLAAAGTALENAREQLRLAERRYETGVGNAVELGDSQLALATAAAQRVQADFNLSASRAQLLHALGREITHG
jgi:outer membrane protein